jgi:hypothetical protein
VRDRLSVLYVPGNNVHHREDALWPSPQQRIENPGSNTEIPQQKTLHSLHLSKIRLKDLASIKHHGSHTTGF